jgi:glycosyltransferase 2 family protein
MNRRKQIITLLIIAAVLALLVYAQVKEWRKFDWQKFKDGTEGISIWGILLGALFVHVADFLRAIRWKIFLRPTRPRVSWWSLVAPQFVGFAGLAILGRPGELVRPYLISKRANTTVPAQVAIWFVERAFDFGAVTIFLAIDIFMLPAIRRDYPEWRIPGIILIFLFLGFITLLYALWKRGPAISSWLCRKISPYAPKFANSLEHKLGSASGGLHTIHDARSLLEATGLSFIIWLFVALAYRQVTHAFPESTGLPSLDIPEVILLMGASIAGGVIQLPVVGGGAQLATIAVLSSSFSYSDRPELAVSAGIMFWLVTFISVAPLGLILARFEHVSIRKLSKESEEEAKDEELLSPPNDAQREPS